MYTLHPCAPYACSHADDPLAMLPAGYGAMVRALVDDANLDVRFGWRVARVERMPPTVPGSRRGRATLHFGDPSAHPSQLCDLLVLSGPLPEYVMGSLDGTRTAILAPAARSEVDFFGAMRPMQFLISLLELQSTPGYRTLEYWPDNFEVPSAVIVRRDVGYGESGPSNTSHAIGGLQSYSYWPVPTANKASHWAAQQQWAKAHGLAVKRVLAQNYIDTYLFHHNVSEVVGEARKPWRVHLLQLRDGLCNCTLYVGGAASFETVEDVFHHNLELVHTLFDAANPPTLHAPTHAPKRGHAEPLPLSAPTADPLSPAATSADLLSVDLRPPSTASQAFAVLPHIDNAPLPPSQQPSLASSSVSASLPSSTLVSLPRAIPTRPTPFPHGLPPRAFVLEQLVTALPCVDVERFLRADASVWTAFLSAQPGYVRKVSSVVRRGTKGRPAAEALGADRAELERAKEERPGGLRRGIQPAKTSEAAAATDCEVWNTVDWYSRELWKAIPLSELNTTQRAFAAAFGAIPPAPTPVPGHANGLKILMRIPRQLPHAQGQVVETLNFTGVSCAAGIGMFVAADNATYTIFLREQPGFVSREVMVDDTGVDHAPLHAMQNCTLWSRTRWRDEAAFEAVCAPGSKAEACAQVHRDFVAAMGYDPPMVRLPLRTVVKDAEAPYGPRLAVLDGIDVVAYHGLATGSHDVWGVPEHRRWLNSSALLPPDLRRYHPHPYELWFATEDHARTFDADPMRFLPAFGGHCTHGIATRNDLNTTLLADGRVAFTCINGSKWAVLNGTLYLTSCGMFRDFQKQPTLDVTRATALWRKWFGEYVGPLNDACVQDDARWGGDPIGGLIPTKCVLN